MDTVTADLQVQRALETSKKALELASKVMQATQERTDALAQACETQERQRGALRERAHTVPFSMYVGKDDIRMSHEDFRNQLAEAQLEVLRHPLMLMALQLAQSGMEVQRLRETVQAIQGIVDALGNALST